ncbi:MAG: acylphosphatase [bacterium]
MKSRAHIFVSGIVQGVFFRDFTQSNALSLGLTGWVRNLPDGRVEALTEGEKGDIEHLIERLKVGPSGATVDQVEVRWEEYQGEFTGFDVRVW